MMVAVLQVVAFESRTTSTDGCVRSSETWQIVGVFATKELAEAEASLRGYTRWSVSEFGVQGL